MTRSERWQRIERAARALVTEYDIERGPWRALRAALALTAGDFVGDEGEPCPDCGMQIHPPDSPCPGSRIAGEDPVARAADLLTAPLPEAEPERKREAIRRAEKAARILAEAAGR